MRRAGYNYAEVLISNVFITGTLTVLSAPITLLAALVPRVAWLSQLVLVLAVLYPFWVNYQLLQAAPHFSKGARYRRAFGIAVLQLGVLLLYATGSIVFITIQTLREHPEMSKTMAPVKAKVVPARKP